MATFPEGLRFEFLYAPPYRIEFSNSKNSLILNTFILIYVLYDIDKSHWSIPYF